MSTYFQEHCVCVKVCVYVLCVFSPGLLSDVFRLWTAAPVCPCGINERRNRELCCDTPPDQISPLGPSGLTQRPLLNHQLSARFLWVCPSRLCFLVCISLHKVFLFYCIRQQNVCEHKYCKSSDNFQQNVGHERLCITVIAKNVLKWGKITVIIASCGLFLS